MWSENNIVAITPFLLTAHDGPFAGFSFTDGDFKPFAQDLMKIGKTAGKPQLAPIVSGQNSSTFAPGNVEKPEGFKKIDLRSFFSSVFNLFRIRL